VIPPSNDHHGTVCDGSAATLPAMQAILSSRLCRAALGIVVLVGGVATTSIAQSPAPAPTGAPSQPPSPAPGPRWPLIRFVGGVPDLMTVTSDCGIPGVDTFHLILVGAGNTGQLDVTLTDYDAANMRFTGREVGQISGQNAVWDIDDAVTMSYDLSSGNWYLKGFWMDRVPIEVCLEVSPAAD